MNPSVVFGELAESRDNKNMYQSSIYLKDTKTFDFGGTFIPRPEENTESVLSFEIEAYFNLVNTSNIPCDVTFALSPNCAQFQLSTDNDIIPYGSKKTLKVTANPIKANLWTDTLLISIKDNPKINTVKMSLLGCDSAIDVNPKYINFEKATTNTSISAEILLTNSTPIKLVWCFTDFDESYNNATYTFSQTKGNLEPLSVLNVLLCFKPEAELLFKTEFKIRVFLLFFFGYFMSTNHFIFRCLIL